MEKTGWKITAITSLVLLFLTIVTFSFLVNLGIDMIETEQECINVCYQYDQDSLYVLDDVTNLCQCYDYYDNVIHQQYIIK